MSCRSSHALRSTYALIAALSIFFVPVLAAESKTGEASTKTLQATFAGGCFWCMEGPFDKLDGVLATVSGYIGGTVANPTYEQVSSGSTGHAEAVSITYDPERVSYEKLLEVFWRNIDPTNGAGQFCDHGNQYRPAIFYHDEAQHMVAEASLNALKANKPFKEEIQTTIDAAGVFYPAEDYHQDYYVKNPVRYKFYRFNCGRDQRLAELWGKSH